MRADVRVCVCLHARVRTYMFMLPGSRWMTKASPVIIIYNIMFLVSLVNNLFVQIMYMRMDE